MRILDFHFPLAVALFAAAGLCCSCDIPPLRGDLSNGETCMFDNTCQAPMICYENSCRIPCSTDTDCWGNNWCFDQTVCVPSGYAQGDGYTGDGFIGGADYDLLGDGDIPQGDEPTGDTYWGDAYGDEDVAQGDSLFGDVDYCADAPCDPLVSCSGSAAGIVCGPCPEYFQLASDGGCVPINQAGACDTIAANSECIEYIGTAYGPESARQSCVMLNGSYVQSCPDERVVFACQHNTADSGDFEAMLYFYHDGGQPWEYDEAGQKCTALNGVALP